MFCLIPKNRHKILLSNSKEQVQERFVRYKKKKCTSVLSDTKEPVQEYTCVY